MPAHLKALVVVLFLAAAVFAFAKKPACALAVDPREFERRRNLWFAMTLTVFLAHSYWLYIAVAGALMFVFVRPAPNTIAVFFALLFAVPPIAAEIPSPGIVDNLFIIHYIRLLALAVLLPVFLDLRTRPGVERLGATLPDKLILGYLVLNFLLSVTGGASLTNTLRYGVFYAFIDTLLPYYVASRSLRDLPAFRDALMSFVVAAMVVSAIGFFELVWHWLLYSSLDDALRVPWDYGRYLQRGTQLRAQASVGQPIPLGYVVAVGLGFYLYLQRLVPGALTWRLGALLLVAGLIAPMSRGPWIGAAAMVLTFIALGPSAGKTFAKLALFAVLGVPLLLASPAGETVINHLPFVGTLDEDNVNYRERLLQISLQLIMDNPLFGSFDYFNRPELDELRQREGMVDFVNSYLGVALSSGLVGLALYAGFFAAVAARIFGAMRSLGDRTDERYALGQGLLATLLGILLIIFTVSSITVIPVIYWCVAGMGVAYARLVASPESARAVRPEPGRPAGPAHRPRQIPFPYR